MVLGQFAGRIDTKARVAFPKRFRKIVGDRLIVTQGYEYSLIIVGEKGWEALLEGTKGKPFVQKEARETQRYLLGNATFVELDKKGRFIVPQHLREFSGIAEDVIFLGLSRYIELWDKKRWEVYKQNLEKNIDSIAKKLIDETKER